MNNQYTNLFNLLYPIGSTYIGTQNDCPLTSIMAGSAWSKIASTIVIDVNTSVSAYGTGKTLGLTNGSQNFGMTDGGYGSVGGFMHGATSVYNANAGTIRSESTLISGDKKSVGVVQDANASGLIGDLTRTNLTINIWKRIS